MDGAVLGYAVLRYASKWSGSTCYVFILLKTVVRLAHVLGQAKDMLVFVHSLKAVSDKSGARWVISQSYERPSW